MAKRQKTLTSLLRAALLSILTLLLTLFPVSWTPSASAAGELTLSKSIFSVGYPSNTITVTGSALFPFRSDTVVTLYDPNGQSMNAIADQKVVDSNHMTFTLQPGLNQGRYTLVVRSYQTATAELDILTNYDPTHVLITPGANRDIRIDWTDPNGLDLQDIKIEYAPIDQAYSAKNVIKVNRGVQTYTLTNLINNQAYKFRITSELNSMQTTQGMEFTNGGNGYVALDTTPPGDLRNIQVNTVTNGFNLTWIDPADPSDPNNLSKTCPDLNLVTIQYAEHGTTNWSDGFVVAKGVQHALIQPLNLAKRYDFRFTKTDTYGNWSYQLDTHNGYGYSFDTQWPGNVNSFSVANESDTSEMLTWTDPTDDDFNHVNIYLKSPLTDWKLVGRANKGMQSYTLNNLATNINYTVKATSVDTAGNESPGAQSTFQVHTLSYTDLANLEKVTVSQQVDGGLQLKWDSNVMSSVDFNSFRVYYAPVGTTDLSLYKQTPLSNESALSASLEEIPQGTYNLQLRFFDQYGIEQSFEDLTNGGAGYYVSGTQSNGPAEVNTVRIQPDNGKDMQITWNAASSNGTQVALYVAEQSSVPNWTLLGKVDIRNQSYTVQGLSPSKNYFFKLVVIDTNHNTQSQGVVYNNSGFGYNLLGGDTTPPQEVSNAEAVVSANNIAVTYTEPSDPDFDSVNVYVYQMGSSQPITNQNVPHGQGGTTLLNLLPGKSYTLKITTLDTVGNESSGTVLNNNGQGYTISGSSASNPNDVRNAVMIPQTNQLTVRFMDPLNPNYDHAVVTLTKANDSSYSTSMTASKGTNEVTFYNLEPNSLYQVSILAYTTDGKPSNGVYLGGNTGISLLPVANVSDAKVTPGNNRLTVSWLDPTEIAPSAIQVELQRNGSSTWTDPKWIQPGTGQVVIGGLPNDSESYRVRITTLLNQDASTGVIVDNGGMGFSPRNVSIAPNPQQIQQNNSGQVIAINGTNTRFSYQWGVNPVTLFDSSGQNVSSALSNETVVSSTQMQITVNRSLAPGTYTLVVNTPQDGELRTTLEVLPVQTAPVLSTLSVPSVDNGYAAFSMTLTGTGFTPDATVVADNGTKLSCTYMSSQQLQVNMPSGFQPGTHKLYVTTSAGTSKPLSFNVHAFSGHLTLTTPTTRSGLYHAQLTVQNLDANMRSGEVLFVIRRNSDVMETKTVTNQFSSYETKQIKLDFGGAGTPYADGPTDSISIQAYIVDSYSLTPLSEPITYYQDLNL